MEIKAWEMLPEVQENWTQAFIKELQSSSDAQLDFALYPGATTAREYAQHILLWNVTYLASIARYLKEQNRLPVPEGDALIALADQYLPQIEQDFTGERVPQATMGKAELIAGLQQSVPWVTAMINALSEDDLAQKVSLPVNRTPRIDRLVYIYLKHSSAHFSQITLLVDAEKQLQHDEQR